MIEIKPPRIEGYPVDLRTCIKEDYPERPGELPIKGGWGYSREDAIVIDKQDFIVVPGMLFDGVGMEYVLVEKRIYYELIIMRQENDRYSGIKWELIDQKTDSDGGHRYDHLRFNVTAHRDRDFEELQAAFLTGRGKPGFDEAAHFRKHEELLRHYVAEYWFEISSFYGQ